MGKIVFQAVLATSMIVIGLLSGSSPWVWMGAALIALLIFMVVLKNSNKSAKITMGEKWKAKFPDASYSYAYGDYGIAVDEKNLKIQLMEEGHHREYPLSAVRSWRANLVTGGEIVYAGGNAFTAIALGAANRKQAKANLSSTGLFVSVKDVDKPEWRIKFSDDEIEEKKQQNRWCEILTQVINERN